MLFSCTENGIDHRLVDISQQGLQSDYLPVSLGLRSQTLKLGFISPETKGHFLKPQISLKDTLESIERRFSASLPKPIYDQNFIGETLSVIYSPFYADSRVIDAVLNRPVSQELPEDMDFFNLPGGSPDWQIKFIPALCPDCGWDLDGARDSLALSCNNCNSYWQSSKKQFTKLKFAHIPGREDTEIYLPFWRIRAEVSGVQLNSYADLVRLANLPKVVQKEWEESSFRFWSVGFKVRPQEFIRFARNLSLSQPQDKLVPELPKGPTYPVTLPVSEAVESLKLNLAGFMKPPKSLFPNLPDVRIKAKRFTLIFVPFYSKKGNELANPDFHLNMNRNLLTYARHL